MLGKLYSFKQWFAPFDIIQCLYWRIIFDTRVHNMFRYLLFGSVLCFHCVTRWIISFKIYLFFSLISERKWLIKNSYFLIVNVPFLIKDKISLNFPSFYLTTSVIWNVKLIVSSWLGGSMNSEKAMFPIVSALYTKNWYYSHQQLISLLHEAID